MPSCLPGSDAPRARPPAIQKFAAAATGPDHDCRLGRSAAAARFSRGPAVFARHQRCPRTGTLAKARRGRIRLGCATSTVARGRGPLGPRGLRSATPRALHSCWQGCSDSEIARPDRAPHSLEPERRGGPPARPGGLDTREPGRKLARHPAHPDCRGPARLLGIPGPSYAPASGAGSTMASAPGKSGPRPRMDPGPARLGPQWRARAQGPQKCW